MSKYSFSLQNYHAVKEAHIDIDGLTVLAGINGSGKSTLSRWLYYLINVMHEFEHIQKGYFVDSLANEIDKVVRLFRTDALSSRYENYKDKVLQFKDREGLAEFQLGDLFTAFTLQAEKDLKNYVETATPVQKRRLTSYLINDRMLEANEVENVINYYVSHCTESYQKGLFDLKSKLSERLLVDLEETIQNEYGQYDWLPDEISIKEDGLPLFDHGSFIPPLMLSRAVYIDSPMVLSDIDYYNVNSLWGKFKNLLFVPNGKMSSNERLLLLIQKIIGGKVKLEEDDIGFSQELHYVANNGVDIRIEDTATGIKSFAYISRLLENGWIDKETLLMIDEPEAHLHPQWIVEFARLLVLIHKELGAKIMIASHNPDMVAAIQSIASKEDVIDRTKFYLAERDKDTMLYRFIDKGTEIGDIFESFNIAMSRIEQYGTALM